MRKTLAFGAMLIILSMVFATLPAGAPPVSGGLIFHAHFDSDAVDAPPDTSLPGDPVGDSLALNAPAGYIMVRSAIGDLTNQPVEVRMTGGTGGVNLIGTVAGTPPNSGIWIASWRGLVRSGNWSSVFGPMVFRDSSNLILASVEYRENGEIDFNDLFTGLGIGVTYTQDVSQYFELIIDLDTKTTSLSIDGAPVPLCQNMNYYEAGASDLAHMNFEVGYTTPQAFALDDMKIASTIVDATIDIDPDTLNLKSKGKWITCYIEVPSVDAYTITQSGVTHFVTPVARASNDAVYYDYWSASAHTEFVEPFVSKMYLYTNTLTGELSFFVHHNIDSNTPPHIGSASATVRFDFDGLPAGVTMAQSDDTWGELDLTRAVEGIWGFGHNTDGGVIGDLPTDLGWSFSIDPTFGGSEPMTSWVYVDSDGSEISLDMTKPVTVSHVFLNVGAIDVSTVAIIDINGNPVNIPAESHPTAIGDEDGDSIPDLMVKFDRSEVQDACSPGLATITVSGEFMDGTVFEGSDTITVIDPP